MDDRQQSTVWPRLAGLAGLVLAFILTAMIWLQVIDQQATAMSQSSTAVPGTAPAALLDNSYAVPDAGAPRPIP